MPAAPPPAPRRLGNDGGWAEGAVSSAGSRRLGNDGRSAEAPGVGALRWAHGGTSAGPSPAGWGGWMSWPQGGRSAGPSPARDPPWAGPSAAATRAAGRRVCGSVGGSVGRDQGSAAARSGATWGDRPDCAQGTSARLSFAARLGGLQPGAAQPDPRSQEWAGRAAARAGRLGPRSWVWAVQRAAPTRPGRPGRRPRGWWAWWAAPRAGSAGPSLVAAGAGARAGPTEDVGRTFVRGGRFVGWAHAGGSAGPSLVAPGLALGWPTRAGRPGPRSWLRGRAHWVAPRAGRPGRRSWPGARRSDLGPRRQVGRALVRGGGLGGLGPGRVGGALGRGVGLAGWAHGVGRLGLSSWSLRGRAHWVGPTGEGRLGPRSWLRGRAHWVGPTGEGRLGPRSWLRGRAHWVGPTRVGRLGPRSWLRGGRTGLGPRGQVGRAVVGGDGLVARPAPGRWWGSRSGRGWGVVRGAGRRRWPRGWRAGGPRPGGRLRAGRRATTTATGCRRAGDPRTQCLARASASGRREQRRAGREIGGSGAGSSEDPRQPGRPEQRE